MVARGNRTKSKATVRNLSRPPYNLEVLGMPCLIALLGVLQKCTNLWCASIDESKSTIAARLSSYRLILTKLREYQPTASLSKTRHIVRQFKTRFSKQYDNMPQQLIQPSEFLRRKEEPLESLSIPKSCSFCATSFDSLNDVWMHMVLAHLPPEDEPNEVKSICKSLVNARKRRHLSTDSIDRHLSACQKSSSVSENINPEGVSLKRSLLSIDSKVSANQTFISMTTTLSHVPSKCSEPYLAEYSDEFLRKFIEVFKQCRCLWDRNDDTFRKDNIRIASYVTLSQTYKELLNSPANLFTIKCLVRDLIRNWLLTKRADAVVARQEIWSLLQFLDLGRSKEATSNDFVCSACQRSFKLERQVLLHYLKYHPPKTCNKCQASLANGDELKAHLFQRHGNEPACPICNCVDNDWKSYLHMGEHFYFNVCPQCSELFVDVSNFKRHKRVCVQKNRFKCHSCDASFSLASAYRNHAKKIHMNMSPFKCDECDAAFSTLAAYNRHKRTHRAKC